MNSPEGVAAGLTDSDLYTVKGQEKAMKVFTGQNISALQAKGVPVTLQTLYFTHHFGKKYIDVFKGKDSDRLPDYFTKGVVPEKNPKFRSMNVKTLGGLKDYLDDALARGERTLPKQANKD